MPLYTILHVEPISAAQMEEVAKRFSIIHSQRYKMPPSWVNVNFLPVDPKEKFYIGGKFIPSNKTRISGTLRPGESRTVEGFNAVVEELAAAYTEVVGGKGEELVYVANIAIAVKENGLVLPRAGTEVEWFNANKSGLTELAKTSAAITELVKEFQSRTDRSS